MSDSEPDQQAPAQKSESVPEATKRPHPVEGCREPAPTRPKMASEQDERQQRAGPSSADPRAASGGDATATKIEGRKARYVTMYDVEGGLAGSSLLGDQDPPTTEEEAKKLVENIPLFHGDVVAFEDYRDVNSYIVFKAENGEMSLIKNPDYRAAGYLTIPQEVLATVDDAVSFYKDFLEGDFGSVILLMSPHDKFVVDRFGKVPDEWEFQADFDWGEVDFVSIRRPGKDWVEFNEENLSREAVDKRFGNDSSQSSSPSP